MKLSQLKPKQPKAKAKPKLTPLPTLVKRADEAFSRYVRLRDSEFKDGKWIGECITCQRKLVVVDMFGHWNPAAQNGHYVGRGRKILRWDELNCNLQCLTAEAEVYCADGNRKRIADVEVGDKLVAFNEQTFADETATVLAAASFMARDLYEVELADGTKFRATGDHRVVCEVDGAMRWVRVDELVDMLHNQADCNIIMV